MMPIFHFEQLDLMKLVEKWPNYQIVPIYLLFRYVCETSTQKINDKRTYFVLFVLSSFLFCFDFFSGIFFFCSRPLLWDLKEIFCSRNTWILSKVKFMLNVHTTLQCNIMFHVFYSVCKWKKKVNTQREIVQFLLFHRESTSMIKYQIKFTIFTVTYTKYLSKECIELWAYKVTIN